jgi:hypothetical protein
MMPLGGQLAGEWVMPEREREVGELFEVAVRIDLAGREAWPRAACGGDDELRTEVGRLLSQHERVDRSVEYRLMLRFSQRGDIMTAPMILKNVVLLTFPGACETLTLEYIRFDRG